jgi:5'-methylthioadenosine phosphorylase
MVTDYDAWADNDVDAGEIVRVMNANVASAQALVGSIARRATPIAQCGEGCDHALDRAVMTAREAWPPASRRRLATLAPRIFG